MRTWWLPIALGLGVAALVAWWPTPANEADVAPAMWEPPFVTGAPGSKLLAWDGGWTLQNVTCPCPEAGAQVAPNASVRVTVWVFDANRLLVATNVPAPDHGHQEYYPDFVQVPDAWWYLGEGEAPNGSRVPPALRSEIRASLVGSHTGQVVSMETRAYDWAIEGGLWVTGRIEAAK